MPRKRPLNRQLKSNPSYNNNSSIRNQSNGHNDPNVQLTISTSTPDHIAELLEATRKMTRYFKKSYRQNKHTIVSLTVTTQVQTATIYFTQTNTNAVSHNTNDQVNEIIDQTSTSKNTKSDLEDIKDPPDSNSPDSNHDSLSESE